MKFRYNDDNADKQFAGKTFKAAWGTWDYEANAYAPGYAGDGRSPELEVLLVYTPSGWQPLFEPEEFGTVLPDPANGVTVKTYPGFSKALFDRFEIIIQSPPEWEGPRSYKVTESRSIFTRRRFQRDIVIAPESDKSWGTYVDVPDGRWTRRVWYNTSIWIACEDGHVVRDHGVIIPEWLPAQLRELGFTYPEGGNR